MQKKIKIDPDNIFDIIITDAYTQMVSITKSCRIENVIKSISFSIWDDISFRGYTSGLETDTLEFLFDIRDPLYFCLNRLLDQDLELLIDDDDTYYDKKRYMLIRKENHYIKIIFKNLLSEDDYEVEEKFRIFIKNIGPDPRSKIDNYNFKCRIVNFLRDCEKTLLEEYHQITIDEYIEILNYLQDYQKVKQKKLI